MSTYRGRPICGARPGWLDDPNGLIVCTAPQRHEEMSHRSEWPSIGVTFRWPRSGKSRRGKKK